MKKAILIICVLSMPALLVVSVAADDAVSVSKDVDSQTARGWSNLAMTGEPGKSWTGRWLRTYPFRQDMTVLPYRSPG